MNYDDDIIRPSSIHLPSPAEQREQALDDIRRMVDRLEPGQTLLIEATNPNTTSPPTWFKLTFKTNRQDD